MSKVTNGPCHLCGKDVKEHTFTFAQVYWSTGDVEHYVNAYCTDGVQTPYRSIEVRTS